MASIMIAHESVETVTDPLINAWYTFLCHSTVLGLHAISNPG